MRHIAASPCGPSRCGRMFRSLASLSTGCCTVYRKPHMAFRIIETCIGCTACVKRCPTDAITGERKGLHIIWPELCIDCGACGPVCPVDAILDQYGNVQHMLKKNERPLAFVYEQACTGCEKCVERCPFEALEMVQFFSITLTTPRKL